MSAMVFLRPSFWDVVWTVNKQESNMLLGKNLDMRCVLRPGIPGRTWNDMYRECNDVLSRNVERPGAGSA